SFYLCMVHQIQKKMCLGTIETLKEKRHQVSLYLYIANACFVSKTKVLMSFLLIRVVKI
ncbi:MAG: hypothetical protein JWR18_989, partial [Segetibacter sp.]|nr:hypothetical protein [Segetibacter sp.]